MPTDIDCSGMVYAVKDADGRWVTGENFGGSLEETGPKKEPKAYHCLVCGRQYADRAEAKKCMRNHDWQNRRGRR